MLRQVEGKAPGVAPDAVRFGVGAGLIVAFVAVVAWFSAVDFYAHHFFDTGPLVIVYNLVRIVLVVIFSWLIYAPGAAVVALVTPPAGRAALWPAERGVLGFGIGVGIWHVVMLILGALGWYYRFAIDALCLLVLLASSKHFADVACAGWRLLAGRCNELRRRLATAEEISIIVVGVVAAWLLLQRGLYPGGGGDYYTHYFYYYLAVIQNHGLAPNDVWYHFYYSKGSGLAFLGMLLADPETPALATYTCVICAAVAIFSLLRRMAPNSLWPVVGTLVYLLFYVMGVDHSSAEGEFQKDHEEVAALVVLTVWALCMERRFAPRPFRIMAAASAIAAAFVTQTMGIVLGLFVGLLWIWSVVHRRWSEFWGYGLVGASIAAAVLGIFVYSYLASGMASDQPLDLMLRFADPVRLARWGVIPQIIAVAWIRDNYQALVEPLGWGVFKEVALIMRFDGLWPFLLGPAIAVVVLKVTDSLAGGRLKLLPDASATSFAAVTATRLAVLLGLIAVIALSMGRAQSVSFARLSTFFVPLVTLFGIACSVLVLSRPSGRRDDLWAWMVLPVALLIAVTVAWQKAERWVHYFPRQMSNVWRFAVGGYSLAAAYAHTTSPFEFGAINPGALAAARELPLGTRIWSTNVDSYCMAPGCQIESVSSFKMSDRLDEILGDDPALAKRRLQEAGLNYFLFMKKFRLLDLLPYSSLFSPETIGRYLGIKWTDGSTFLLTWIGPDTSPIGPDFLDAYVRQRDEPESPWFIFSELVPRIVASSPIMRKAEWGKAEAALVWRHPPPGAIDIVSATYGRSCRDFPPAWPGAKNTYREGNSTAAVKRACTGKSHCHFSVEPAVLGDPVPGCAKDFSVEYRCGSQDSPLKTASLASEVYGAMVALDCGGVETTNAKSR